MHTAIYTRQSVEKRDSLSLDAQKKKCIALCIANEWQYTEYTDSGFSGKNTKRPALLQLIEDVKSHKINRVIVYRMDRMSRSVLDFAEMLKLFEDNDVAFISATEQFDTSTPMGRAMVYITMTFAQMERETIRERVRDSWYHRAKQGIFTGGKPPYGYISTRKIIKGKEQSVLKVDKDKTNVVKKIFDMYVLEGYSLNAIANELNAGKVQPPRSDRWTSTAIKIILKNVIYAPATPSIYQYYSELGLMILNDIQDFTGKHGAYVGGVRKGSGTETKLNSYGDQFLIVGRHRPIVSDNIWLAVQYRLSKNINTKRAGTSKVTWLGGLVKCSECGYGMQIRKNSAGTYYMNCGGRSDRGADSCSHDKYHRLDLLEMVVIDQLKAYINNAQVNSSDIQNSPSPNIDVQIKITQVDEKINNIVSAIESGAELTSLTTRLQKLEEEKAQLIKDLVPQQSLDSISVNSSIDEFINNWDDVDVHKRSRIVKSLIDRVVVDNFGAATVDYKF